MEEITAIVHLCNETNLNSFKDRLYIFPYNIIDYSLNNLYNCHLNMIGLTP